MGTNQSTDAVSRTLFGETRRAVLALLYGRPEEQFYLREIVRTLSAGLGGVQRELANLVLAGLVSREVDGRQVYFSANQHSIIFPELKSIIDKTAGVAEVLRAALGSVLEDPRVEVAFVYGSVARGGQTSPSDVDLMVIGSVSLAYLIPALRRAEARVAREINPSIYPAVEFRKGVRENKGFLKRVLAGPKLYLKGDDRELARLAGQPLARGARGNA